MFKTKGGAGGQRLFEQCSKKLRIWYRLAPLKLPVFEQCLSKLRLCQEEHGGGGVADVKGNEDDGTGEVRGVFTAQQVWQIRIRDRLAGQGP